MSHYLVSIENLSETFVFDNKGKALDFYFEQCSLYNKDGIECHEVKDIRESKFRNDFLNFDMMDDGGEEVKKNPRLLDYEPNPYRGLLWKR